jgi:hypothetical protein
VDVVGVATVGGAPLPFRATFPIAQTDETEVGVPVVRSPPGAAETHEVSGEEEALRVTFDPAPWVQDIDFMALVGVVPCAPGGPPLTCLGDEEQTCDDQGNLMDTRDCAALGQRCVLDLGCVEELQLDPESQGGRSVRTQIVAGPIPDFQWIETD